MTMNYSEKLNIGQEYQDFVMQELLKEGIVIQPYSSWNYQITYGESVGGIEVKFDSRIEQTGNLYIETAEKSSPNQRAFTNSGVYRIDNTWIYCIGDASHCHLCSKKQLAILLGRDDGYKRSQGIRYTEGKTSRGFLMPESFARRWLSLKEIVFSRRFEPGAFATDIVEDDLPF